MSRPCTRSQANKLSGMPVNLNMNNEGLPRLLDEALGSIREDIKRLASKDYLDAKINELEKRLLNKLELQSKEIKTMRKKVADLQDRLEDAELAIDDGSSTADVCASKLMAYHCKRVKRRMPASERF